MALSAIAVEQIGAEQELPVAQQQTPRTFSDTGRSAQKRVSAGAHFASSRTGDEARALEHLERARIPIKARGEVEDV